MNRPRGTSSASVLRGCTTILKAFLDETFVIPNPVVPSDDGLSVNPYTGADADQMIKCGGEIPLDAGNASIERVAVNI